MSGRLVAIAAGDSPIRSSDRSPQFLQGTGEHARVTALEEAPLRRDAEEADGLLLNQRRGVRGDRTQLAWWGLRFGT